MIEDRISSLEVYVGAAFGGYPVIHVNDRLTAPEVAHILADSGARALFHTDGRSERVAAPRPPPPPTPPPARPPRPPHPPAPGPRRRAAPSPSIFAANSRPAANRSSSSAATSQPKLRKFAIGYWRPANAACNCVSRRC